jgi:glycosyltransferase involved in cell wall biosynthesis
MKVAIVHDWLTGMRGGEKCLEVFVRLFPQADLYTLLHVKNSVSPEIENRKIKVSFLQNLPFIQSRYRYYLPLMPFAISGFDLRDYDLVLSSSHCVAKAVRVSPKTLHVCYCHTPMRYIWDQFDQYFARPGSPKLTSLVMKLIAPSLRRWDVRMNRHVDFFIANSQHVQKRIKKYYERESSVIYPPVDTDYFKPQGKEKGDFFLILSAFAPYKRVDLAVEAFNKLGYPLVVIGTGQDEERLRRLANKNIQFKGWLEAEEIRSYLGRCRALIFPGEEDFGITPVEAQAMGRPVIAYGKGGALETVVTSSGRVDGEPLSRSATGVFFDEPTVNALVQAVSHFETIESSFDPDLIRQHAQKFDTGIFADHIKKFIDQQLSTST